MSRDKPADGRRFERPEIPGGCLGLMSLMLVAPTALVALAVKAVRR